MKAHRGLHVYLYLFFNLCTRRGWMVNTMHLPLNPQKKDLVPTVHEAEWASGLVWTGTKNLVALGFEH